MDIRGLKRSASEALGASTDSPTRLYMIHIGVAVALSLVLTAVSYGLDSVSTGGGLSSMGTQSVISTIQVVLQLAYTVTQPFWAAGLIFAAMGLARQQSVVPGALLEGFRRFRSVLVTLIWRSIQYFAIGFACVYLSSIAVNMIPFPQAVYDSLEQFLADPTQPMPDMVMVLLIGYVIVFAVIYGLLALPVYYRYRMVEYVILDDPSMGGLRAMYESRNLMRGNRLKLLRLDVSFWWFYLLDLLVSVLSYGDLILLALGVTLPFSESIAAWAFQFLGLGCRFGLYVWAKPKLTVTYAMYYDSLLHPQPEAPKEPPKMPWKY